MSKLYYLLPLVLLSACGDNNLPKYYALGGLRILALKASTPEVAPGDSGITITPILSDIAGAGRTLNYRVEVCSDPGISVGAEPNCNHDPTKVVQSGTLTLSGPRYTEATTATFTVDMPATILSQRTAVDQYNGVSLLIHYQLSAANGESTSSFRRLIASTKNPKNSNPALSAIQQGGVNLTSLSTAVTDLIPILGAGAQETYNFMGSAGNLVSKAEAITVTWFTNTGSMKYSRTDLISANGWTPPEPLSVTPFLAVIVRDDRGGCDFKVVP